MKINCNFIGSNQQSVDYIHDPNDYVYFVPQHQLVIMAFNLPRSIDFNSFTSCTTSLLNYQISSCSPPLRIPYSLPFFAKMTTFWSSRNDTMWSLYWNYNISSIRGRALKVSGYSVVPASDWEVYLGGGVAWESYIICW